MSLSTLFLILSVLCADIAILFMVKVMRLQNDINRYQNKLNQVFLEELKLREEKQRGQDRAE